MSATAAPNIVLTLADDMGYGDASCMNPDGKIPTPHIDGIAAGGMIFTDAHATSAVCSPSRYSVLTGRYNWRSPLQKGIVGLYGESLISPECMTVPKFLGRQGYHTACIGKWHLGMGWDFPVTDDFLPAHEYDKPPDYMTREATDAQRLAWAEAFSKPVAGGPKAAGFDYYFGVDVPNWPPYCYIENDRTVGIPSEWLQGRLLGNMQASLQGPAMPYWNFEQLLPTFADKADRYIGERTRQGEPFFLYMALTSPHTPLAVNREWIGKSGLKSPYADFVMETDDIVGRVVASLRAHGAEDNTLILFTSDNGCAHMIGADRLEALGHYPSACYRGYKSDIWDGGHRIPLVAKWPGVIGERARCSQLVCLSDLLATCAEITGDALPETAGGDSFSLLPVFRNPDLSVRDSVVHHSVDGKFAIRTRRWKLVLCPGSGGWSHNDTQAAREGFPPMQLYDMQRDPGEKNNLFEKEPELVRKLAAELTEIVHRGRSTPGRALKNDVPVDILKSDPISEAGAAILDDIRPLF